MKERKCEPRHSGQRSELSIIYAKLFLHTNYIRFSDVLWKGRGACTQATCCRRKQEATKSLLSVSSELIKTCKICNRVCTLKFQIVPSIWRVFTIIPRRHFWWLLWGWLHWIRSSKRTPSIHCCPDRPRSGSSWLEAEEGWVSFRLYF